MNNALKNLLDIFDVELNEEFCLTGYQAKFRITERGLEFYNLDDSAQGWQDNPDDISCIIKEQMLVYKPWHPPVGESYYVPCLDLLGYKEFVWEQMNISILSIGHKGWCIRTFGKLNL